LHFLNSSLYNKGFWGFGVCNLSVEITTQILTGIRDEIVEATKSKKVNLISLNLPIGVLTINKVGQIEFKSNSVS
jgi:hypothetical protein